MKDPDLDLTTCNPRSALAKVTMMMLMMMIMITKLLETKLVLKLMAMIVALVDDNELRLGYLYIYDADYDDDN